MNTISDPQPGTVQYSFTKGPERMRKWCDRWLKKAKAAGLSNTKMFSRTVTRGLGGRPSEMLTMVRIGKFTQSYSFGAKSLSEISDEDLRKATADLMRRVDITTVFDF